MSLFTFITIAVGDFATFQLTALKFFKYVSIVRIFDYKGSKY